MNRTYEERLRDAKAAGVAAVEADRQKRARQEAMRPRLDAFFADIEAVYRKHNMSISHQDAHGGFLIEEFDESNLEWLKAAECRSGKGT